MERFNPNQLEILHLHYYEWTASKALFATGHKVKPRWSIPIVLSLTISRASRTIHVCWPKPIAFLWFTGRPFISLTHGTNGSETYTRLVTLHLITTLFSLCPLWVPWRNPFWWGHFFFFFILPYIQRECFTDQLLTFWKWPTGNVWKAQFTPASSPKNVWKVLCWTFCLWQSNSASKQENLL